jgi:hypothetical protein
VGPHWGVMIITYFMIIIPSIVFIIFVANEIHYALVIVASILISIVLSFYSYTACSDPGIVYYQNPFPTEVEPPHTNLEGGPSHDTATINNNTSNINTTMMECSQCKIMRPNTARHCYYCNVCVDKVCNIFTYVFIMYI